MQINTLLAVGFSSFEPFFLYQIRNYIVKYYIIVLDFDAVSKSYFICFAHQFLVFQTNSFSCQLDEASMQILDATLRR